MQLYELIERLESLPKDMVFTPGFGRGESWRGAYEQIAFEPVESATVEQMLQHAKSAIGTTLHGYKGGEYECGEWTECNVAEWGKYGGDSDNMSVWWATNVETAQLKARIADLTAEVERLRAENEVMRRCLTDIKDSYDCDSHDRLSGCRCCKADGALSYCYKPVTPTEGGK